MIFTEDLLKSLCKEDPNIHFLPNTHRTINKEEHIVFYDLLTRKQYTLCFNYSKPTLGIFIDHYASYSISEKVRIDQIKKTFLPVIIPVIKDHPTFRIKLALKECSIDDRLLNEELYSYSLQELLDEELNDIENYYFLFSFSLIGFCFFLVALYFAFMRFSSIEFYIFFTISFIMIMFFSILLTYFFKAFYVVIKQYFQLKKIKKL